MPGCLGQAIESQNCVISTGFWTLWSEWTTCSVRLEFLSYGFACKLIYNTHNLYAVMQLYYINTGTLHFWMQTVQDEIM